VFRCKAHSNFLHKPLAERHCERWVGDCRRDLLKHVIVFNERHLKRLINEYIRYYFDDRTYLRLSKQTPAGRAAAESTSRSSNVVATLRLGGVHRRYDLAVCAVELNISGWCS
jgi:hypothetical protein